MKIKRILSSALIAVMLLTAVAPMIPVKSEAAYSSQLAENVKSDALAKDVVNYYMEKAKFNSAEEMFQYDLGKKYLEYSTNGIFSVYVNKYTGVMYYRNEITGEMLTSNTYNVSSYRGNKELLSSQIVLDYAKVTDTKNDITMYSSQWAALRNQISITHIDGGLRVNYALGNTSIRELVPLAIEMNAFEEKLLRPMMDLLQSRADAIFGEGFIPNYFESDYYDPEEVEAAFDLHLGSVELYKRYVTQIIKNAKAGKIENIDYQNNPEHNAMIGELNDINENILRLLKTYVALNPDSSYASSTIKEYQEKYGITALSEGKKIYCSTTDELAKLAGKARILKSLCPNYTFDMMYEDEQLCGYTAERQLEPVFRLSLEYTINDDGTLSVRLPSGSIVFDETQYILKSITPLQFLGAANFHNDGYIFVPDGSGAIVEFDEFVKSNVQMSLNTYGRDYCYSEIQGSTYGQQVTVPVYGCVRESVVGGGIDTGFFAIIEEGASMAEINVTYKNSTSNEGSVYSTFKPYPIDNFDLSDTMTVSQAKSYSMVAESKYTGAYETRYTMLSVDPLNVIGNGRTYHPSYIGMADCYRDYLEANGVLTELQNVDEDELPLYIEALGSIEIVEKFLTFPVTVNKAITTFEDVQKMYEELSNAQENAKARLLLKADEYEALAAAETQNENAKAEYLKKAESFRELANKVVDINHINFKLTGFANGGMTFTYPSKVKWERKLGGRRGFKKLLKAADANTGDDSTFGVYPDFDFQYINNTKLFDGVRKRNTASKMVDNRYASKQMYSNITGEFESIYALLISPDSLDKLYSKFLKKYDNFKATGISVSTLGSDLNSNFNKKNPISRDEAQGYVTDLLDRIADDYSVMTTKGNIYAVKYADHILDVCTDASYYRYSSYAVPFLGMILHGYVNYTGSAFNYSGSPDYDLLRSIESGASLYYILGYRNTDLMKEDEELNKYYSVSYENWFNNIVETYAKLNFEIGDLQSYKIVDHKILIGERSIDDSEKVTNLNALKAEFIDQLDKAIAAAVDAAHDDMYETGDNRGINLQVDVDALVEIARAQFELDGDVSLDDVAASINALIEEYNDEFGSYADPINGYLVEIDTLTYESVYKYVTGSIATDKNYEKTDYTVDNNLIVMVTYANDEGKTRTFILNYNIYDVEVVLAAGEDPIVIGKYGFHRIDR